MVPSVAFLKMKTICPLNSSWHDEWNALFVKRYLSTSIKTLSFPSYFFFWLAMKRDFLKGISLMYKVSRSKVCMYCSLWTLNVSPICPSCGERGLVDSFWCQITEECAGGFVFSCLATSRSAREKGKGVIRKKTGRERVSYRGEVPDGFRSGLLFFSRTFLTMCQNIEPLRGPSCRLSLLVLSASFSHECDRFFSNIFADGAWLTDSV